MKNLKKIFTPNQSISKNTTLKIYAIYIVVVGMFWALTPTTLFPSSPLDVLVRSYKLFTKESLGRELITSFFLSLSSMSIAVVFSLFVSYLSTIPAFRPISFIFSKGRFNSLAGISILFLLFFPQGLLFKTMVLAFSVSVFYVTAMDSEILSIEKEQFTHARTLGFSEWRVLYEVAILGKSDKIFEIIRQTAAISWLMIATVESYYIDEGGIGAFMLKRAKYIINLPDVITIQILILLFAILQDQIILWFKNTLANWSTFKLERK